MTSIISSDRINQAIAGTGPIDTAFTEAVAEAFGFSEAVARSVVRGTLRASDLAGPGFEIRTGAWRLDLTAATVKAIACGTVSTILLQALGADSIPVTVLSIVAPILFELDRVEVAADDLVVHARLTAAADADILHLADLYERLPPDVQAELPIGELAAAVERLRDARLLSVGPSGVELHPPAARRPFRLLLR